MNILWLSEPFGLFPGPSGTSSYWGHERRRRRRKAELKWVRCPSRMCQEEVVVLSNGEEQVRNDKCNRMVMVMIVMMIMVGIDDDRQYGAGVQKRDVGRPCA